TSVSTGCSGCPSHVPANAVEMGGRCVTRERACDSHAVGRSKVSVRARRATTPSRMGMAHRCPTARVVRPRPFRHRPLRVSAVAALTPEDARQRVSITALGLPDARLHTVGDALTDALGPALETATLVLGPLVWDGHPDHEVCGAAVAAACPPSVPRAEYPVWA